MTETGPGTLGGALLRRYWQPVALAEEVREGSPPLPLRILGEDLVLFRDDRGRLGLLGLHCSHRGTDLSYGRVEAGGLRCLYHGWLYDIAGRCLEQPGEPSGSRFADKIRHPAYPCLERAGLVFAYLGPGDPPVFPLYECFRAPVDHVDAIKIFHACNYLQANEGNIDPQHLSFLHRLAGDRAHHQALARMVAPRIETEETSFGLRITTVREEAPGRAVVRVSNFIYPNLSAFPGEEMGDGFSINWHVPVDDHHHWKFMIRYRRLAPLDKATWRRKVLTGHVGPDWYPLRRPENRYLQDRGSMDRHYAGLGTSFADHDLFAVESQGPIQDRQREHLGYTDKAIAHARRLLLQAVAAVERGEDPPHVMRPPHDGIVADLLVLAETVEGSWQAHVASRLQFLREAPPYASLATRSPE